MKKLLSTFILAIFIVTACGTAPTQQPTTAMTKVTAIVTATPIPPRPTPNKAELEISDPTKTIETVAGDEFTITVKTSLSPERHWEVAEELDSKIVAYVWKDHVPDDPNKPNSSGRDVWRFKAVAPGKTTIILGYYQGMNATTSQKSVFIIVVK